MTADPSRGRHWMLPAGLLVLVMLTFAVIRLLEDDTPALDRGVAWIAARQQSDGSWKGEEIAVLRPGPAMTALVLHAMTRLPERLRNVERMNRAVRYVESRLDKDGVVGMGTDGPDYPNYATSLAILSFVAMKPDGWEKSVSRMADYLKRAQLDESEGWLPEDPEYGGWGFGGLPQPKPNAHRLDISSTRFALEALAAANVAKDDNVWSKARRFLETCQNFPGDGGFRFTPLAGQNKAAGTDSYGSATADGVLALRAAGGPKERLDAAEAWIRTRFTAERCPGFAPNHPRPWADALHGYWLAASCRITDATGRALIRHTLTSRQRSDGSWMNPSDAMLENEPLLATTLAVIALADAER